MRHVKRGHEDLEFHGHVNGRRRRRDGHKVGRDGQRQRRNGHRDRLLDENGVQTRRASAFPPATCCWCRRVALLGGEAALQLINHLLFQDERWTESTEGARK